MVCLGLPSASAQSSIKCAASDPRRDLATHEAAFVGSITESTDSDDRWIFTVERSVKAELGERVEVEVRSDRSQLPEGSMGVLIRRIDDRWVTSACEVMSPQMLIEASQPLPRPNGRGPVSFLVAGRFGEASVLALDASGRTLMRGPEQGTITFLDVCPGERFLVEVNDNDTMAIRSMADLRVQRSQDLRPFIGPREGPEARHVAGVHCLDAESRSVALFVRGDPQSTGTTSGAVVKAEGSSFTRVIEGEIRSASFFDRLVYLRMEPKQQRLVEVNIDTGASRQVVELRPDDRPLESDPGDVDPSGTQFAALIPRSDWTPGCTAWLAVVTLSEGKVRYGCANGRTAVWLGPATVAAVDHDQTWVYDSAFTQQAHKALSLTSVKERLATRSGRLVGTFTDQPGYAPYPQVSLISVSSRLGDPRVRKGFYGSGLVYALQAIPEPARAEAPPAAKAELTSSLSPSPMPSPEPTIDPDRVVAKPQAVAGSEVSRPVLIVAMALLLMAGVSLGARVREISSR